MSFLKSFDSHMRRVVQENPSLSRENSKRKRRRNAPCCLFAIMMAPLVMVLMTMYVLSTYNEMVRLEQEAGSLLKATEAESKVYEEKVSSLRKKLPLLQTTLVLETKFGDIRIQLAPELSQGSVDYIHRLIDNGLCRRCNLYRAEKPGILQGVMANRDVPVNDIKGTCPDEARDIPVGDCPAWDKSCGCHGPLMTKGSVAWAAGQAGGPDFFIDNYKNPAKFWGTQHTNFGKIQDDASFKIIDQIFELPVSNHSGMHVLEDVVQFKMRLE